MNTFQTSNSADEAAVKRVAETLMLLSGETSTLEVKRLLRLEGYTAYQRQISLMMEKLASESNWTFTCNGLFRTYSFRINMDFTIDPKIPSFSYN